MGVQVKCLVEEEGLVSSSRLLNLTGEMERKISADDAQTFFKDLYEKKWLQEVCGVVSVV